MGDIFYSCTLETYIILLTNVNPINSIKFFKKCFFLTIDLSDLSIQFFPFLIYLRTFTFHVKTLFVILFGVSKLPAALFLYLEPLFSIRRLHLNISTVTQPQSCGRVAYKVWV